MKLSSIANELSACQAEDLSSVAQVAIHLARQIQQRAKQLQTPAERRQQAELDRMVQHPRDKATLTQMTDQAFRSQRAARAADQMTHILDVQGIPRFFSPLDRTMLRGFQSFGGYLPGVAVPLVKEKMRHETANVILPAEPDLLGQHLKERIAEGIRMNVNLLGEAILGEHESQQRLAAYLSALQMPEIECVSIKVSTLYSQISTIARSATVRLLVKRLELLYRAAARHLFTKPDGTQLPKFVYLDMEEYRDMELTGEVFMKTLDMPDLLQVRAGIALQAYIPDSFLLQRRITQWAQGRVARGGAPITVRIVKGANMEMERVEASHRGWPQAPYNSKLDTDANYKRMVRFGLQPENLKAVKLGIASHNLFEVSFAIVLAAKLGGLNDIQFEMLEGMANHQRRALHEIVDNLLLYAPACQKESFINAIGYLVRRMDENTGPENFLRHAFKIEVDSADWREMEQIFLRSIDRMTSVSDQPRRRQDRFQAPQVVGPARDWREYVNEADTDFTLPSAAQWASSIVDSWINRCDSQAKHLCHSIDLGDQEGQGEECHSLDPSRPGVVVARFNLAAAAQMQQAVRCAAQDPSGWRSLPASQRSTVLCQVAAELSRRRADLMGAALADAGKTLLESDPEVSEAIDFARFYALTAQQLCDQPQLQAKPKGAVVVISPWNFPIAIPCGGIVAALAAGNTVIFKPAIETALVGRLLCECLWDAGVPRQALQLVICDGPEAGQHLLSSPQVAACVFTGGTQTALRILQARPHLHLLAETGGKNATIVSSLSDRDLAVKNILHSAFSHSGQKCSATSLLLLEDEVYHDRQFRELLIDAASSLRVGSAWDLKNKLGPLIRPPQAALLRGLTELEPKERWALMPNNLEDNPCLYSPGIKWDVQPGSFTHLTELFGPVLAVMHYNTLDEAIELVHATGYGLTSGLESLDDREQEYWSSRMQAGNLYINRPTTGAIVLRQPFGGMGKSAFGPGIKAGGPNYVVPLMDFASIDLDPQAGRASAIDEAASGSDHLRDLLDLAPAVESLSDFWNTLLSDQPAAVRLRWYLSPAGMQHLAQAVISYDAFALQELLQSHDTVRLVGQDNIRRYKPISSLRIRLSPHDTSLDIVSRIVAATAVGAHATVSQPPGVHDGLMGQLEAFSHLWTSNLEFIEESDGDLIDAIERGEVDRLRYAGPAAVPLAVREMANRSFIYVADNPVCTDGRIELLWYVCEQSLSVDYHRYGNLGFRADETRRPVL